MNLIIGISLITLFGLLIVNIILNLKMKNTLKSNSYVMRKTVEKYSSLSILLNSILTFGLLATLLTLIF